MAKKVKKKGFGRFFLCSFLYALVFLALTYWGLTKFWAYIEAYELSRPKTAINPYMEQLDVSHICDSMDEFIDQFDHNIQSKDACREYIADSMSKGITHAQKVSESTDTKLVYMLMSGGKTIGKVTMNTLEADEYGFTPWKVTGEEFNFDHLIGQSVSITVPHDFTVYANGVALSAEYIIEDHIQYEVLEDYYADYIPPYMVTYAVGPILGDITLTTTDRSGKAVEVTDKTDFTPYIDNCTEDELTRLNTLMNAFLKRYVAFTSNAGGKGNTMNNYYSLSDYLVPNGSMVKRMYKALDGLGWAADSGSVITDTKIHRYVNLGNNRYLCDITYTVEAQVYRDDPITVNNAKIIILETNNGLFVESLTNY